jgi:hypothetical protein
MRRWFLVLMALASVAVLAAAGTASFPWQWPL